MIYGITDLTTFILGTIFVVLLPGPNSLYVMTLASRHGIAAGYWGVAAIFTGDAILMVLAATGAASVLYASPAVFTGLKLAGAVYLAWLGIGLIRSGIKTWRARQADFVTGTPHDSRGKKLDFNTPFRTALFVSLLNPKSILFFVSFFIQFVDPDYPYPGLSFFILGLIVQIASLIYLSALIWGGARLANHFAGRPLLSAGSTALVGLLFIGFAIRLSL